jgi:oxygen-dependent protoporphyrinogen oxidase
VSDRRHPSIAVVGGGIAGLSAAFTLVQGGAEVTVFEAGSRAGGKLWADDFGGHRVDRGADAFLARVPDAVDLCRELGLDAELTAPVARSAYVLRDRRLRRFPDGLVLGVPTDFDALAASGVVSPDGVERARLDLSQGGEPVVGDAPVGPYVRDRVGDEVFEALVSPLLAGINAGDPDLLSLDAGAPQLAAAAHAGGSLVAHLRDQRARASADPDAPVFYSLTGGAGRLAEALVDAMGDRLILGSPVERLERRGAGYGLTLGDRREHTSDGVVLATPAFVTAPLLAPHLPDTAAELDRIDYATVSVVTFSFAELQFPEPLEGSGFLVPESEGLLMTACSWGSNKWPHWSDPTATVLRASVGRAHDPRAAELDDDTLVDRLLGELATTTGVSGPPLGVAVTRWPRALPQYRPGHLERLARWEAALDERLPGVVLAGATTRGLGVPACVGSGRHAARRLLAQLA